MIGGELGRAADAALHAVLQTAILQLGEVMGGEVDGRTLRAYRERLNVLLDAQADAAARLGGCAP